jgi:hypothetical protein
MQFVVPVASLALVLRGARIEGAGNRAPPRNDQGAPHATRGSHTGNRFFGLPVVLHDRWRLTDWF